jgi:hypothetical protein
MEQIVLDRYNRALKNNIVERGARAAETRSKRIVLMSLR